MQEKYAAMKILYCNPILLALYFVIIGIASLIDVSLNGLENVCQPAFKSEKYRFNGTIKHTIPEKMDLLWVKNKTPVSMCKSNMACYEYSDVSTLSTIKRLGNDTFQYSITIRNVSYLDEGVWSLKYIGLASLRKSEPLFSCTLNVYDILALKLYDCPKIIEEEESVQCWCRTINGTKEDIDITWFDANGREISTTENMISYIATRRNSGYQCRGVASTGEKVVPVNYKPLIVAKPESVECMIHYNKSDWKISCMINRIYPQAVCHFDIDVYDRYLILEMDLKPELKTIEYTHEYLDNDRLYFKSLCTLHLPFLPYLSNYTVKVIANPNVTGSDSDLMYAVKQSISGYYVPPMDGGEIKNEKWTSIILIVIVCVVLIHFLLLIVLCRILRIRTSYCSIREKAIADEKCMSDDIETYLTSTENLRENNTLFDTGKVEQEHEIIEECNENLELLGIVLKHSNSNEGKSLISV